MTNEGWRYLVFRANGEDSTGEYIIEPEAPLKGVEFTDQLSGPPTLTATIDPFSYAKKAHDGRPIYLDWGSLIFAEDESGEIQGGGILIDSSWNGTGYSLTVAGYTVYPQGQPYVGNGVMHVGIDLCDAFRTVWSYFNTEPGAFLGLEIDSQTMSGVKIGTELKVVDFETGAGEQITFESGPWKLSWHTTDDLGRVIDDLLKQGIEYREYHSWRKPEEYGPIFKSPLRHYVQLSAPGNSAGSPVPLIRRRQDVRIVLEENAVEIPTMERSSEDYASTVQGLGAGDGPRMVRVVVREKDPLGRLYRAKNVTDSSLRSKSAVTNLAKRTLDRSRGDWQVTSLAVRDSHLLQIGSVQPGDEIRVTGEIGAQQYDDYLRVVSVTITPDTADVVTLSLVRPDQI